jgi:inosine-uridine nucleoside N-ribohydrolase
MSPEETWRSLFKPTPEPLSAEDAADLQRVKDTHSLFTPSLKPAHEEMLQLLRDNEPDTITIVAIGPLTNLAIAAAIDPEAFLRVKEVVVMGGAVNWPGNVSRAAHSSTEFHHWPASCNKAAVLR